MTPLVAIVETPLALDALVRDVEGGAQARPDGCGAVATFVGVVRRRHAGKDVRWLEYEAYAPLALNVFRQIQAEAAAAWPDALVAIHHRVGRVAIGEASVIVAAASAHRDEACRACRYGIERVKQIAPIWKHEFFAEGDAWVEGAVARPDDEVARREAMATACA